MSSIETFYPRRGKPRTVVNPQDHRHFYSPKIALLLGHMTIHWAALEFQVKVLLWYLTENPEIGDILTRRQPITQSLDDIFLVARYRIKDDVIMQSLQNVIAAVEAVRVKRNNYVHPLFAVTSEIGCIAQSKGAVKGKKLKRQYSTELGRITTAELDALIKEIHAATTAVHTWEVTYVTKIGSPDYRLPPLRHTQ